MARKALIALLLLSCSICRAQSGTIRISGRVLDLWDKNPLSGVSVISPRAGVSLATDAQGNFTISCNKRDTLFLFLSGYQTSRFSMADSSDQAQYTCTFEIEKLITGLSKSIEVHPRKGLKEIEKEREKMGRIPKELQQPEVSLSSPISALYELLSDRAKERSKLREQILNDERRRIYYELFDYYKEAQLFDLPNEYYDQFIDYLGQPVDFLKHNTDYAITKTILDTYKKFGLEKGFIK